MKQKNKLADEIFLQNLTSLAQQQAKLHRHRLLPSTLDPITSFIGKFPWQTILVLSFVLSYMWEGWR